MYFYNKAYKIKNPMLAHRDLGGNLESQLRSAMPLFFHISFRLRIEMLPWPVRMTDHPSH